MQYKKLEYIQAIISFVDDYRETTGLIPTMSVRDRSRRRFVRRNDL